MKLLNKHEAMRYIANDAYEGKRQEKARKGVNADLL